MYRVYGKYYGNVGGKKIEVHTFITTADNYNGALKIIDSCKEYKEFIIKED